MEKALFTIAELAERWQCSPAAIRARIQNGTLAKADVPGAMVAYEEVRTHEVILSFGKAAEERWIAMKLDDLTKENEKLKEQCAKLKEWRQKVISAVEA